MKQNKIQATGKWEHRDDGEFLYLYDPTGRLVESAAELARLNAADAMEKTCQLTQNLFEMLRIMGCDHVKSESLDKIIARIDAVLKPA